MQSMKTVADELVDRNQVETDVTQRIFHECETDVKTRG